MCGICGYLQTEDCETAKEAGRELLQKMTALISRPHRSR